MAIELKKDLKERIEDLKKKNQEKKDTKTVSKNKKDKPKNFFWQVFNIFVLFFLIINIYSLGRAYFAEENKNQKDVKVSMAELVKNLETSDLKSDTQASTSTLKKITLESDKVYLSIATDTRLVAVKESGTSLVETLRSYGVSTSTLLSLNINIKDDTGYKIFLDVLPILLPILFIGLLIMMLMRGVRGANMQALSFGQTRAKLIDPKDKNQKVTFKDVAGAKEAKVELEEVVDFLKNPKKFLDIGARIPKGVLLMGPPGTGKTLLARAVAGEAAVPFYHLSGSEFIEMFVGVGASRVRDLFKEAKKNSPAIIFIDEIDAVGRMRGVGLGGGNDEREQTLNQILVEMDGFEATEKIVVIAATNRGQVLDRALLRPGRFDRRVTIDLPDRESRKDILEVHKNKKPLAADVDLAVIAERTPGFSGADLESIMNEGAILAARENRNSIIQSDLLKSIEKVMLGPERKTHLLGKKEKEKTAYHEAGHALVASLLAHADPVHKISIISRGSAGGYTLKLPLDDKKMMTKNAFVDDIAMAYGGYAAEVEVYGDVSTGPSSDIQVATSMARDMVMKYGMSEEVGTIAIEDNERATMYGASESKNIVGATLANTVDQEIKKICDTALATAERLVKEKREILDYIAKELVEKENLERDEFEEILRKFNIEIKKKED